MALDHNVDLNADRLDPQISDTRVAAASALFRPTFNTGLNRNNQIAPPSSFLIPDADAERRRHVERRPQPAAALVRDDLQRRLERRPHQQQQLSLELRPARHVGSDAGHLAAAGARPVHRRGAAEPDHEPHQPRHLGHATAREHRAHDGQHQERVLGPRVGASPTWTRARPRWPCRRS